jgi:hypothetical protein
VITAKEDSDYLDGMTVCFTISKIESTKAVAAKQDRAYTGAAQELVTLTGDGGVVKYRIGEKKAEDAASEFSVGLPKAVNVGEYKVYWYVEADENYKEQIRTLGDGSKQLVSAANPNLVTVQIRENAVTVSANSFEGIYDGKAHGPEVTVLSPKDAEIYYSLEQDPKVRFTQKPAGEAQSGAKYDETLTKECPTFTDAGEYTVYYMAMAGDNYEPAEGSVSVVIGKKDVSIKPDAGQKKTVGEADPAFTYQTEGLAEGDTLSGSLSRTEGESAGSYDYQLGTLGEKDANYNVILAGEFKFEIVEKKEDTKPTGEEGKEEQKPEEQKPAEQKPEEQKPEEQKPAEVTKQKVDEDSLNDGFTIKQVGSKIKVSWGEVQDAGSYEVYVAYAGKAYPKKPVKTVTGTSVTISKIGKKKLDATKSFKVYVTAKKADGSEVLATSARGKVFGKKNGKYTNVKTLKIKNQNVALKAGEKTKIKVSVVKVDKKKKLKAKKSGKLLRYVSSNPRIARVSAKGEITGVSAGSCTIYVSATNGVSKKVNVTIQ